MFIVLPSAAIILIYLLAAVLPAVFLLRYIYKQDTVEKEPPGLLFSLLLRGVLAALLAIVFEELGERVLNTYISDSSSTVYTLVLAFLVVAVVEEGAKFLLLKQRTWHDPNFNCRFDGIVYAVFVSLGFAAFENVGYVFGYGLQVAVSRAFLAIPAHMGFAVFMGAYYGRAKLCESCGNLAGMDRNLWTGYLISVLLHGFYDACAMTGNTLSTILFVAFVVIMYIVVIRRIKRESATDTWI